MFEWRFLHPWFLALLPVPLIWLAVHLRSRWHRHPSVLYSDLAPLKEGGATLRVRMLRLLPWLRTLALLLGIVALARPQYGQVLRTQSALGIDIAIALDISGSMDAMDFTPTRLEAAKAVIEDFIAERKSDRLSVVVFGASAYVLSPPTLDRGAIGEFLRAITRDSLRDEERVQTAVGMGLALAVDKLKDSKADSRIVILLSDGENNAGSIEPVQAAEAAKALGVRVYTIGIGSNDPVPIEVKDEFGRRHVVRQQMRFDEECMKMIAEKTDGRYYRATDAEKLREIYGEIDKLEKTDIEVNEYDDFDEKFLWLWVPALVLLALEMAMRAFWMGRLP